MAVISRRKLLAGGALAVVGGIGYKAYRFRYPAEVPIGYDFGPAELEQAEALLSRHPSIDAHSHPGRTFVKGAENVTGMLRAAVLMGTYEEQTIAEMKQGGLTAAVFAAVGDYQALGLGKEGLEAVRQFEPGEAWQSYRRQIGNLQKLVKDGLVYPILKSDDFAKARQSGKPGALFSVEGGDFLEGKAERVAMAHADGVHSITPLHYRTNELGDIITTNPVHGGLTQAGVAVIKAMNRTGMLVDVAHASEATALGMIEASERPVMASHVHVHPVNKGSPDHPRFISRDLAKAVAETGGGVLGAWPTLIGIADLKDFVARTFELVDIVGIDHVCLGTDIDARSKPAIDSYARLPHYVAGLLRGGMHEAEVAKLIGGNFLRVFAAADVPPAP